MVVTAVTRDPAAAHPPPCVRVAAFVGAQPALRAATHLLATAPPDGHGDPVLTAHGAAIAAAPMLRWIGYLSTTGVYGDRGGAWVDETTRNGRAGGWPWSRRGAGSPRACPWISSASPASTGPGRSPFADLRADRARRIAKPGQAFGRIHRDDIVQAALAAMRQNPPPGLRIFNLADDEPAASAEVVEEAARLLGIAPPPAIPYAEANARMSEMARGFWSENRKVSSARTKAALCIAWRYPTYREGLRAILAEEAGDGAP
jgi:hypothetical protein